MAVELLENHATIVLCLNWFFYEAGESALFSTCPECAANFYHRCYHTRVRSAFVCVCDEYCPLIALAYKPRSSIGSTPAYPAPSEQQHARGELPPQRMVDITEKYVCKSGTRLALAFLPSSPSRAPVTALGNTLLNCCVPFGKLAPLAGACDPLF